MWWSSEFHVDVAFGGLKAVHAIAGDKREPHFCKVPSKIMTSTKGINKNFLSTSPDVH